MAIRFVIDAPLERGKGTPLPGQLHRGPVRLLRYEAGDLLAHDETLFAVVRNAQLDKHIRETHDAQAYLPGGLCHLCNLR